MISLFGLSFVLFILRLSYGSKPRNNSNAFFHVLTNLPKNQKVVESTKKTIRKKKEIERNETHAIKRISAGEPIRAMK